MLKSSLRPRLLLTLLALTLLVLVLTHLPHPAQHLRSALHMTPSEPAAQAVTNGTLGFERVFAVGLAERSDKRDALVLTSSVTGFELVWVDGVRGQSVPDKALPFGVERTRLWENNLGSWRGHMNAVRRIVEEKYSSALIMEDDMDWDVRLKVQLQSFAEGARFVQRSSFGASNDSAAPTSPYGDDWDLLWLGHCGEVFPEDLPEMQAGSNVDLENEYSAPPKFTIFPDTTLPPSRKTTGFQNYTETPLTRWVHVSGGPICTFAYALSASGAKKVLYDLSVDHLLGPYDNALANLCRYGKKAPVTGGFGMRCISVTPPLFFHHKAKGNIGGDSDIQQVGDATGPEKNKDTIRQKGFTENIAWSARTNVKNLILGLQPESQFEE